MSFNLEWIYEVIIFPQIPTKNFSDFCPTNKSPGQKSEKLLVGILGETMTSYIHSENNWPLVKNCQQRRGEGREGSKLRKMLWMDGP